MEWQIFHKYLHESKFFIKTIIDRLSGTQMDSIKEKNFKKSHDTVTLNDNLMLYKPMVVSESGLISY